MLDQEIQSILWLKCTTKTVAGIKYVMKLKCQSVQCTWIESLDKEIIATNGLKVLTPSVPLFLVSVILNLSWLCRWLGVFAQ